MHIIFERSGGFAGMRVAYSVDTENIPPEEALSIQELVEQADFFNLPAVTSGKSSLPDQFQYVLTLETETEKHTLETGDNSASPPLKVLLRKLTLLARELPEE